ncbi:NUDIX domain-containing protein [Kitasatospora sp. NPDC056446]|uniref:NUDIX domain-containing protein n=1 Tax=Kitasatospora sp. NPDC056446 TaxID=3345819 RepID=UPI0036D12973
MTTGKTNSAVAPAEASKPPVVDVHVILRTPDGKILLSQRGGPYGHGQWHAPSGKLDPGEKPAVGAARELREETGIRVDPDHLRLAYTVLHHQEPAIHRLGLFYTATEWEGEPENREPEKCLDLRFFAERELPDALIPYPAAGIRGALTDPGGLLHHGWPKP